MKNNVVTLIVALISWALISVKDKKISKIELSALLSIVEDYLESEEDNITA